MTDSIRTADYGVLLLELIVLVVGILLAFQVDRWWEGQRNHQLETEYLLRLRADLLEEQHLFEEAAARAERRVASVRFLAAAAQNPAVAGADPAGMVEHLERAGWLSAPVISRFVYKEMMSTGSIALIRSDRLRRELARHYNQIDHNERFGLDRQLLIQFERRTDGLLSMAQMIAMEEGSDASKVNSQEAMQLAAALRGRPDALRLLPDLAAYHVYNRRMNVEGFESAGRLVALIDEELGGAPVTGPVAWERG